jgi:hypothetical protein
MRGNDGRRTILVGKYEENRALEGPRHRWKDNIKVEIK